MLVLDYPRTTDARSPTILIPPFHTGHLGFVPGTEVTVGLLESSDSVTASSEIVVTPYAKQTGDLAVLTAVMRDDVGVVERLVGAIAALHLNIEVEESASITHLDEHYVTLLINLSGLGDRGTHTSPSPHRDYDAYVPYHDRQLVRVLESVLAHCADALAWSKEPEPRLAINLRRLPAHDVGRTHRVALSRAEKLNVALALPEYIAVGVRQTRRPSDSSKLLDYLFVTDTEDRSLRVFFLPRTTAKKVFHIALEHDDLAGALAALLRLTAAAEFNILTSLLRKKTASRSVWEAVLEYRGSGDPPVRPDSGDSEWMSRELVPWVEKRLETAMGENNEMSEYRISVRLPSYPISTSSPKEPADDLAPLTVDSAQSPERTASSFTPIDLTSLLARRRADAEKIREPTVRRQHRLNLLDRVAKRTRRPSIFLSFPFSAKPHAQLLRTALAGDDDDATGFDIVTHDEVDPKPIMDEVVRKIVECDFFIGLWHHDDDPLQEPGKFKISPWMHFEYGLAVANGKEAIVVRSEKISERDWKRVNPGIGHPEYSDLTFASQTIPLIMKHCQEHFTPDEG